jgi:hypothetical protein
MIYLNTFISRADNAYNISNSPVSSNLDSLQGRVPSPYTMAYISARHGILELSKTCDPGRPAGDAASRTYR